jgi:hypothetical protein
MLQKEGQRLIGLADEAFLDHQSSMQKLYRKHGVDTHGLGNAPSDPALSHIIAYYTLDDARADLIDDVVRAMNSADVSPDSSSRCPSRDTVRSSYDSSLSSYEELLKEVQEAIENRIEAKKLAQNEGLWLLVIQTQVSIDTANVARQGSLVGGHTLFSIEPGRYVRLVRLKEGVYVWDKLQWGSGRFRIWVELKADDKSFEIKRGKVNYAGVLDVRFGDRGLYTELHDRLTIVMSLLEERMPDLMDEFEMANGLNVDDQFLDFYIDQRRELRSAPPLGAAK